LETARHPGTLGNRDVFHSKLIICKLISPCNVTERGAGLPNYIIGAQRKTPIAVKQGNHVSEQINNHITYICIRFVKIHIHCQKLSAAPY